MQYNDVTRHLILSKIIDFFDVKQLEYKKTKKFTVVSCPYCKEVTANIIPNSHKINCWKCDKQFLLSDIVNQLYLNGAETNESVLLDYIVETLKLDIKTTKETNRMSNVIKFYEKSGFDMVPAAKRDKACIEKEWTSRHHKNKDEWLQWLGSGLNFGVKTGKMSNITVVDIDVLSTEEKVILRQDKKKAKKDGYDLTKKNEQYISDCKKKKELGLAKIKKELGSIIGEPLIQDTLGGEHWFYEYEESLPKSGIEIIGINVDIENDGGQVIVEPCKIMEEPEHRYFINDVPIPKMSDEFLAKLKSMKPNAKKDVAGEEIKKLLTDDNYVIDPAKFELINNNLKGCCNLEMIKLGGKFRQNLSPSQTEFALKIVNNTMLERPMDSTSINNMCSELEKYCYADNEELKRDILNYMEKVNISTKADIELSIQGQFTKGESKQRINQVLTELLDTGRLKRASRNEYQFVKKIMWSDELFNTHKPITFKIPYFGDVSKFNIGDHIIIGSKTGHGKTMLAMNIIKRFVDQGIKPYYIGREGGSRWVEDAWALGLKEGDFFHPTDEEFFEFNELELEDNSVVIYDWYKPAKYNETSNDFDRLDKKLKKHKSIALVFVQLRTTNNEHYACVDDKTECLTTEGWKKYDELSSGDEIAIFDTETEELKYEVPSKINIYNYDGQLNLIENKWTSQCITDNHNIIYKNKHHLFNWDSNWHRDEYQNVKQCRAIRWPVAGYYNGKCFLDSKFAELIGWIITDGDIDARSHSIRISQSYKSNIKKCKRIEYLLSSLQINFSVHERAHGMNSYYIKKSISQNNFDFYAEIWKWIGCDKFPKQNILYVNQDALVSLFNGMVGGDGHIYSERSVDFYQKNMRLIEFMQILCLHIGYTYLHRFRPNNGWGTTLNTLQIKKENFRTTYSQGNYTWKNNAKIDYKGVVWCPTTSTGTWVSRRNNKISITGNSDQIEMFASFSVKYIYDEEDKTQERGEYTRFEINKNRAPKNRNTAFSPILCRFNGATCEVETLDEYNRRMGIE